jgi:hypothetical protein
MTRLLAFIGLIVALHMPAWAQDGRVRVSVSHVGDDSVGKQFAYAVREAIRASNGYLLVPGDQAGIRVSIVTIDQDSGSSVGNATAASISYTMANFLPYQKGNPQTWYPIHLTSQVMIIGLRRTADQARSVMATIDEQLEQFRDASRQ